MKRSFFAIGAMAVAVAANAGTVQIFQTAYSSGSGGEFQSYLTGAAFTPTSLTGNGVETFCMPRRVVVGYRFPAHRCRMRVGQH